MTLHVAVLSIRISPVDSKDAVDGSAASAVIRVRATLLLPPSPPLPVRESLQINKAIHAPDRASLPASGQKHSTEALPPTPPLSIAAEVDTGIYMTRSQLSAPPVAKTAIVLEPPPGQLVAGRVAGILLLFIDEQGRVQRVDAEESALPPAFEQAAREAFMAAEFSPGEIDGRAVKSRQRVEVVFDFTP
ncbi:energy transducer TonB [Variovorax sp. S2]|uniref:energy transducer TonB n=1 Tax=Variovorax sp. S12S4 TaxID=3029170 RepID=UPI00215D57B0|nr:energy transducer TonB [Variovorax sp. S12S4]MCR8957674.1 energy transducer TonB [Variovorax sp. S12S4]